MVGVKELVEQSPADGRSPEAKRCRLQLEVGQLPWNEGRGEIRVTLTASARAHS